MHRLVSIILLGVALTSCEKKDDSGPVVVEGHITLDVHAVHHTWDASNIWFYLERNVTEFPGNDSSQYDFKVQADGYGKATFSKLYPGEYYIYASGYDAFFGAHVRGNLPVSLHSAQLQNDHASVTVNVSE
jgi:hypothetical protein